MLYAIDEFAQFTKSATRFG